MLTLTGPFLSYFIEFSQNLYDRVIIISILNWENGFSEAKDLFQTAQLERPKVLQ